MKKEVLIGAAAFFLISLTAITGVYAVENNARTVKITRIKSDITGDGKNEVITLKGVPFQKNGKYMKKIYIEISASDGKTYSLPLESGEKAWIQLADLNHDGMNELFATVLTGENKDNIINYLFTLKDFKPDSLPVPEPLALESRFLDGYKASFKIDQTNKTYSFDLHDQKNYYDKIGIYQNGKLNEPAELNVNPFNSLTPEHANGGELGLKGVQRITGIESGEPIAFIETHWMNEKGNWKLVQTDVLKDEPKN